MCYCEGPFFHIMLKYAFKGYGFCGGLQFVNFRSSFQMSVHNPGYYIHGDCLSDGNKDDEILGNF